MDLPTSANLIS